MKAVVQRVSKASVFVNSEKIASIGIGLLILLGVENQDNDSDINWLSKKIIKLRIFKDNNNLVEKSVKEVGGDIIVVSQFTLYASTKKGNRPSYIKAAKSELAFNLYQKFIEQTQINLSKKIQTGRFGVNMKVELVNNGPVTLIIDSKNKQ
ncbi:MAG: D-aminoacyl-tRNA deacylase [Tenacibaculum sp.]